MIRASEFTYISYEKMKKHAPMMLRGSNF